ncbi:hypothetical protein FACS1894180_4520 [Bacteroidia bacterium]|nr:hypothetical protein FACS1894180_4520 [Bacteroidia bacterium]
MKTALKTKNKLSILILFVVITGCAEHQKQEQLQAEYENTNPLSFDVKFYTFTDIQLSFDEERILFDSITWSNYEGDTIMYLNVTFENLGKKEFCLKTGGLVSPKIPLLLKYRQLTKDEVMFQIVYQSNTIYSDSIVFRIDESPNYPIALRAYNICYQHNAPPILVCQLPINQYFADTVDISNPNNEHICCIEL